MKAGLDTRSSTARQPVRAWGASLALAMLLACATARAVDTPQSPPPASVSSSVKSDEQRCAAAWREFHRSEACFAPYHVVGGGVKAEAAQHCKEVVQPQCSDPKAGRR
jgi:hypothetical protein